jgi:ABC-type uncharacterized transport system permease subunit
MGITSPNDVRKQRRARLASLAPYIVVIVALILSPLYLSPFNLIMLIKILIFALFAMSLDIIFGYTGLPSFGHTIFFGISVYTTGILIVTYGIGSFWLAAPAGILLAVLAAAVFGFVVTRISEVYFMLATFALGQLVYNIDIHWLSMTNGPNGFPGIPRPDLGLPLDMSNDIYFFFLTLIVFLICFFLLHRIVHSPFGLTLKAIRENEPRMLSLGYRTWVYKYTSFVLGGIVCRGGWRVIRLSQRDCFSLRARYHELHFSDAQCDFRRSGHTFRACDRRRTDMGDATLHQRGCSPALAAHIRRHLCSFRDVCPGWSGRLSA